MTKVAFIQNVWHTYIGTMSLGAFLTEQGYGCAVFLGQEEAEMENPPPSRHHGNVLIFKRNS